MQLRPFLFFVATVLVPFACYTGPDGPTGSSGGGTVAASGCKPDIDTIQRTVFVPRCATSGCHGLARPLSPLDLESPGVEARLVSALGSDCSTETLVVPGDPDASFLVHKLVDTKPSCGARMPRGADPLAADDIACIQQWIAGLPAGGSVDGSAPDSGTIVSCTGGDTACGATCANLATDPNNCGSCGKVCPPDAKFCASSTCVASCPNGTTDCSNACVTTATDPKNCGSCGNDCTKQGKICTAGSCACGAAVASFKTQIEQAIFVPTCATAQCHGRATAPAGSLDLRAGKSYASLVGVQADAAACSSRTRVVKGDVAASYLVDKLKGTPGICGSQMPKAGGISPDQLAAIEAWICNGAANN